MVDYVGNFRRAFIASEFYNFPCFSKLVPDLEKLLSKDERAKPVDKYAVLADAFEWNAHLGYPGYVNAAVDEVLTTWVLNTMFAQASTGARTPEQAIKEAEAKCRRIWAKWQQRKLI